MPACAARAGIDVTTLWRWRKANDVFGIAFALAMTEGRAALEGHALAGAPDDPKHALELLSRRYPKAWGRADRLKLDAKVTDATPAAFKTASEVVACLDRMRAALATDEDE